MRKDFDGAAFLAGACRTVDGFALYAVGDRAHDPHRMALDVSDTDDPSSGRWWTVANFSGKAGVQARQTFEFPPTTGRFWRWQIKGTCCVVDTYQGEAASRLYHLCTPFAASRTSADSTPLSRSCGAK